MIYWYGFLLVALLAGLYIGFRPGRASGDGAMGEAILALILMVGSVVLAAVTGILQLIF